MNDRRHRRAGHTQDAAHTAHAAGDGPQHPAEPNINGPAGADGPRTRAEERIAELDTSPAQLSREIEELREQLINAEREAHEMRAALQRSAADFANYRRRTEQDRLATLGLANEALLSKLLTIVDDFDRAIANMPPELQKASWVEGIVAIDRKLRQLLESEGLTPIEAEGQQFDPHEHEAIMREETTAVPEGTVTAELQRGYRIRDRVLRPAMVAVAANPTKQNKHSAGNGESGGND
ncbi:MAG: nucleotide exchange factor GrpE [Chloroflexota bacterium]|nr:nucleotide exchange factor GrpE [Chloroflexota bacterium]